MADKSTDKNKKNRPDTKTAIISGVLLAAAAAMLIWLSVQLWRTYTGAKLRRLIVFARRNACRSFK